MRPVVRDATTLLLSALGYFVSAGIGTLLSVPPSGFAIIWPATAFLISLFLIVPPGRWWLCIGAVVPTHFWLAAMFQPEASLVVVSTQITGNLVLAVITVLVGRKIIGKEIRFDTASSVLKFILIAGLGVPAVINALILSVHISTGWAQDFWLSWRQWMIAGIFPTITIPPVLVLASVGRLTGQPTGSNRPRAELAGLVILLILFSWWAYGARVDATHWPALLLVPFPFLLWAAVRLGVGGTCLSLHGLATAIVLQALRYNGPFAVGAPMADVVSLQAFLITTSVPLILLAALMDERRRTAMLLRQSEDRMNIAASSTDTGLWQWDAAAQHFWLTDHCRSMFRMTGIQILTPYSFIDAFRPEDQARMRDAIDGALSSSGRLPPQHYCLDADGDTRWLLLDMHSESDETGKMRVSGVFRDVTRRVVAEVQTKALHQRIVSLRDDERRRIAQELHDSTAQHLVAARLNLSTAKLQIRSANARGLVASAIKSLHEATMEIRTISYLLHPPQLSSSGLRNVLQQYIPGFESRAGLPTTLRVSPFVNELSSDQQQALLRITQESLSNVHRHARATRVSVNVRCVSGNVHLIVSDNGKGIQMGRGEELSERLQLGVGIPGMTARVKQLGGRFNFESGTQGTRVHVAIPLVWVDSPAA